VSNGHLPSQSTKSVNINVWSDCSGINSEMCALQALSDSIREIIGANVQCNLYYTCDSDTKSIVFARQNHAPKHVGIDMKQRNFNTGEVWCTLCQRNLPLPKRGIDLYVGTYPCSPWSRRGTRAGWDHPSVDTFRIGVETIAYIQPAVWIIELGELPDNEAIYEVIAAIREACSRAGSECTIQVVRDLMPSHSGYPVRRTRSFFLGWRMDMGSACHVVAPLTTLTQHPINFP